MKVIEDEDLVDQQLISELRKEYGMTYNDFFMVLTDTDMKVKVRVLTHWKKRHLKNTNKNKQFWEITLHACMWGTWETDAGLGHCWRIRKRTVREIFRN